MEKSRITEIMKLGNMNEADFLIGMINCFNNHFQTVADLSFEELSWKQIFFLNCIYLFNEPPTIRDMANILGCSHQNAKQILTKLQKAGYVTVEQDKEDKRKQRIFKTKLADEFRSRYYNKSKQAMKQLFSGIDQEKIAIVNQVINELDERLMKMEIFL